jgi:hypothetical protein
MTCDHVYGDVAGLSAIYLTDDESMMTMMRASQEQLACDIPPTKRKYFAMRNAGGSSEDESRGWEETRDKAWMVKTQRWGNM